VSKAGSKAILISDSLLCLVGKFSINLALELDFFATSSAAVVEMNF